MSTITMPPRNTAIGPHLDVYRMTVDEYERLVASGRSTIPESNSSIGSWCANWERNRPHVWSVEATQRGLVILIPPGWYLPRRIPFEIPALDEPEPDLAVVRGSHDDYQGRHPGPSEITLVIEVAETILERDRNEKLAAYARSGIPVYWIVNLRDRQLEVYTDPGPNGYASRLDSKPGQDVPVVIDGIEVGRIAVSAMLP